MHSASRAPHSRPRQPTPASGEPIRPGELWPIRLLHQRLRWGARTRAAAIREGLPVHRWGKLAFILTDDLIQFLTTRSGEEK
jgi:hypothetical protein